MVEARGWRTDFFSGSSESWASLGVFGLRATIPEEGSGLWNQVEGPVAERSPATKLGKAAGGSVFGNDEGFAWSRERKRSGRGASLGEGVFFGRFRRPRGTASVWLVLASAGAGTGSRGRLRTGAALVGREAGRERGAAVPEACRVKLQRAGKVRGVAAHFLRGECRALEGSKTSKSSARLRVRLFESRRVGSGNHSDSRTGGFVLQETGTSLGRWSRGWNITVFASSFAAWQTAACS